MRGDPCQPTLLDAWLIVVRLWMPVVCKHFLYTQNMAKEAKYCEIMQHKIVGETHGEAMDGDGVFVPLSHVLVAS